MRAPRTPSTETQRLAALRRYDVLDTVPERAFDVLVELAAYILDVPIALVSLVDSERQWFKARHGLEAKQTPREVSFCGHVVADERMLVVEDAHLDERFHDNPLVTCAPNVRAYAGAPLLTADGHILGTLCVIDHTPRSFSEAQLLSLAKLASQVIDQLELRRSLKDTQLLVAAKERAEQSMQDQAKLLVAINQCQNDFIGSEDAREVFDRVLTHLLSLTGSAFGFLGELCQGEDRQPYLRTFAISNIAWNEESRRFYEEHAPRGLEFRNLDSLFGRVLVTQQPVISLDPQNDARAAGTPAGHPVLRSFLGLPLLRGSTMVGMVGIANSQRSYDDALIEYLEPLLTTVANLIDAHRTNQQRRASENALSISEARLRSIFDTAADGLLTMDSQGTIEQVNPRFAAMVGYEVAGLCGQHITRFIPDALSSDGLKPEEVGDATDASRAMTRAHRELSALRRDGTELSVELSLGAISHRKGYTAVVRDISERKKMDRMKAEFISAVSHELRTPLTSIRGSLGLLEAGLMGSLSSDSLELVAVANRNAQALGRLVDDILDLEKISSDAIILRNRPLSLWHAVRDAMRACAGYATSFHIQYQLREPAAEGYVTADEDRLAQVLANLLSNAAKFSPAGEIVELTVERNGSALRVGVHDRGPGIPREFRDRIFQRFAQADGSDARSKGGTGLGLSIAKSLVERMGGRIWFESELGRGTHFYVEFPELASAPQAAP